MSDNTEQKIKLRPVDKIIGAFATGGVLAGLGATMWVVLPILLPLLVGTVALVVCGVMLLGLLFVISDKTTRGLLSRMYRLAVQKIGLALVRYDPIGTLKDHINELRKRSEKFKEQRTTLKGIVHNLTNTVNGLDKERENFLAQAITARETGEDRIMTRMAKAAERRKESYDYLNGQLQQLVKADDVIGKLAQEASDVIEDCEDELSQLTLRDKSSAAASGALRSVLDILGDNDMSDQQLEAVAIVEERVGRRLAEMDMAFDKTTGLIGGIDVKNATISKKALDAVLEYEKRQPTARGPGLSKKAQQAANSKTKEL